MGGVRNVMRMGMQRENSYIQATPEMSEKWRLAIATKKSSQRLAIT